MAVTTAGLLRTFFACHFFLSVLIVAKTRLFRTNVSCEYSRFSLFLAARNVSPGGTSGPHWHKFHTDDVNQCLHYKSGSYGVPDVNLFDFMFSWPIMVKSCVLLGTSSSKTQVLFLTKNKFHEYWLFWSTFIMFTSPFTFDLWDLLSVIRKQHVQ